MILPAAVDQSHDPRPTALYAAAVSESAVNRWATVNGWAAARVFSSTMEEYDALTNEVAVVDLGPLCRYTVRGVDASNVLARITTAPVRDLAMGESGRGLVLDKDGMVVDLCDVARLSGDLYLLTTSSSLDRRLQVAARGLDVVVENISTVVAALGLFGPKAREAAGGAGFDFASGSQASQGRVRGVETFIRPTEIGRAVGVEIIYPAEEALILWERVRRAAKPTPAGLDACDIVRIEGGAPRPGVDFISAEKGAALRRRLPHELGLPHLAPANRAWFNGRRALAKAEGDRRLVTLTADVDRVQPGAPILVKGATVGQVTSAAFSPSLRAAVCFADIDRAGLGKPLDVVIASSRAGEPPKTAPAAFMETVESGLAAAFRANEKKATESETRRV